MSGCVFKWGGLGGCLCGRDGGVSMCLGKCLTCLMGGSEDGVNE